MNTDFIFVVGGLAISAIVIGYFIYNRIATRKRIERLSEAAERLNLTFNPDEDYELSGQFAFLTDTPRAESCTVSDVFSGKYRNHDVLAFDFHYETSTAKGGTAEHDHSAFVLKVPVTFPDLTIQHAGLLLRTLVMGAPDLVKLESVEFSKSFLVWSKDKKFAYDICTPAMMEYLLGHHDLHIRIKNQFVALVSYSPISIDKIEFNLQRLVEIRSRLPEYLFTNA